MRDVVRVEVEGALLPAHRRRVEDREQSGPRLGCRNIVQVVGKEVADAAVQRHLHGAELAQRPAYGGLGRAEPPDEVSLRAGTERAQPARHESQVARRRVVRRPSLPQPLLGQRPARPRDAPVARVGTAQDAARGRHRAQEPGSDREAPAVGLARGQLEALCERRDPLAQLSGGRRPVGQCSEHLLGHPAQPGVSVGVEAVADHLLGQPRAQLGLHPRGGAPPHRRQQCSREGEQGASHGELLDHAALVVERPVDVGPRRLGSGERREVDAGRLGGVQAGHPSRPPRARSRTGARARAVPRGAPGAGRR